MDSLKNGEYYLLCLFGTDGYTRDVQGDFYIGLSVFFKEPAMAYLMIIRVNELGVNL
jgi:hypothetical protein